MSKKIIPRPLSLINYEATRTIKGYEVADTYSLAQSRIIKCVKENHKDIKEFRLSLQYELLHLEKHDFEQFVGLRLGLWGYILAVVAIIFSIEKLLDKFLNPWMSSEMIIYYFIIFIIVVIITLNRTSSAQKRRMIFLQFTLQCLDKIKG